MKVYLAVFVLLLLVPIGTAEELEIQPPTLSTSFILTDDKQDATYKFTTNRQIESCVSVEGACRIVDGYIVFVDYQFDTKTKLVNDIITIIDNEGNAATVDVSIKIIDVNPLVVPAVCVLLFCGLVLLKSKSKDGK